MSFDHNSLKVPSWRGDAAGIVEEILTVAALSEVDGLLDLRRNLLRGQDWSVTLDQFLACRLRLEKEHYLPFYRLRQLLAHRLALETRIHSDQRIRTDLRQLLRRKFISLAQIRQTVRREQFEQGADWDGIDAASCWQVIEI